MSNIYFTLPDMDKFIHVLVQPYSIL
uniref:Uncharacterized protein n=1 Tax=Anguilla anguilla TaxID=7936 RepID=A0A0E9QEX6_ANGAN